MSKVTALRFAATKIDTLKGRLTLLDSAFSTMKKQCDALAPVVSVFVAVYKLVDDLTHYQGSTERPLQLQVVLFLALTAVCYCYWSIMGQIGMVVSGNWVL